MKPRKPAPVKFDLRLPAELRAQLSVIADRDNRSATQQTIHYIQRGIQGDEHREEAMTRIEAKLDRILALLEKQ